MFVTIDMVVVIIFWPAGVCESGAAPSFIKRGRKWRLSTTTLPVGVLSQVEVESDRRTLKAGVDYGTDGAGRPTQLGSEGRVDVLESGACRTMPTRDLAENILQDSIAMADGRVDDDMMVVVARLVPGMGGATEGAVK